jgi:hypothetical protein
MHAWIGFFFSCAMIVLAAAGKSGYQIIPAGIGGTPDTEFMFFVGCAGFAAALAMLAPSHSTARLASIWSAGALAAVTVALNMTSFTRRTTPCQNRQPPRRSQSREDEEEKPAINVVLKRTVSDRDFVPFEDFDYRIRQMEREMPPQPKRLRSQPAEHPAALSASRLSLRNKRSAALCASPSHMLGEKERSSLHDSRFRHARHVPTSRYADQEPVHQAVRH